MSEILNNSVPLSLFWRFKRLVRRELTPELDHLHNPEVFDKNWIDPNPQEALEGLGKAKYTVLAVDEKNPLVPLLKNGKPYLTNVFLDLDEAATPNVPPDAAYQNIGTRGMPIDMTRWDPVNYYLDVEGLMSIVVVKDRRVVSVVPPPAAADGYNEADRARSVRIELMLTALLEKSV